MKLDFDKKKLKKAHKAIMDCCLHCEDHFDECPVAVAAHAIEKELK